MKQLNYFEKLSNGLIIGSVRWLPLDPRWGRTPPSLPEAEAALETLLPSGLRHQINCISSIRVTASFLPFWLLFEDFELSEATSIRVLISMAQAALERGGRVEAVLSLCPPGRRRLHPRDLSESAALPGELIVSHRRRQRGDRLLLVNLVPQPPFLSASPAIGAATWAFLAPREASGAHSTLLTNQAPASSFPASSTSLFSLRHEQQRLADYRDSCWSGLEYQYDPVHQADLCWSLTRPHFVSFCSLPLLPLFTVWLHSSSGNNPQHHRRGGRSPRGPAHSKHWCLCSVNLQSRSVTASRFGRGLFRLVGLIGFVKCCSLVWGLVIHHIYPLDRYWPSNRCGHLAFLGFWFVEPFWILMPQAFRIWILYLILNFIFLYLSWLPSQLGLSSKGYQI